MRRLWQESMKFLKQYIATLLAICVLAVGAMAVEPQKDKDQKPPPPKEKQEVPNREKPPPPPKNDNNNRGNDGRKKP
jgi:hypothetical protein